MSHKVHSLKKVGELLQNSRREKWLIKREKSNTFTTVVLMEPPGVFHWKISCLYYINQANYFFSAVQENENLNLK